MTAVVHATVASMEECTEPDDSAAWTFVTLDVHDVLTGALDEVARGDYYVVLVMDPTGLIQERDEQNNVVYWNRVVHVL